eukprot:scaffold7329_cov222-Pinguiococcus_pyrenoidosus.AAC.2
MRTWPVGYQYVDAIPIVPVGHFLRDVPARSSQKFLRWTRVAESVVPARSLRVGHAVDHQVPPKVELRQATPCAAELQLPHPLHAGLLEEVVVVAADDELLRRIHGAQPLIEALQRLQIAASVGGLAAAQNIPRMDEHVRAGKHAQAVLPPVRVAHQQDPHGAGGPVRQVLAANHYRRARRILVDGLWPRRLIIQHILRRLDRDGPLAPAVSRHGRQLLRGAGLSQQRDQRGDAGDKGRAAKQHSWPAWRFARCFGEDVTLQKLRSGRTDAVILSVALGAASVCHARDGPTLLPSVTRGPSASPISGFPPAANQNERPGAALRGLRLRRRGARGRPGRGGAALAGVVGQCQEVGAARLRDRPGGRLWHGVAGELRALLGPGCVLPAGLCAGLCGGLGQAACGPANGLAAAPSPDRRCSRRMTPEALLRIACANVFLDDRAGVASGEC